MQMIEFAILEVFGVLVPIRFRLLGLVAGDSMQYIRHMEHT